MQSSSRAQDLNQLARAPLQVLPGTSREMQTWRQLKQLCKKDKEGSTLWDWEVQCPLWRGQFLLNFGLQTGSCSQILFFQTSRKLHLFYRKFYDRKFPFKCWKLFQTNKSKKRQPQAEYLWPLLSVLKWGSPPPFGGSCCPVRIKWKPYNLSWKIYSENNLQVVLHLIS